MRKHPLAVAGRGPSPPPERAWVWVIVPGSNTTAGPSGFPSRTDRTIGASAERLTTSRWLDIFGTARCRGHRWAADDEQAALHRLLGVSHATVDPAARVTT
jgi:hypothetical protein